MLKPLSLLRRRFTSLRWRTRITLWVAATVAGLLVVMFARLADMALTLFATQTAARPWLPFVYTPLVGMLVVWLTTRFFPGSQGSGIPQVIAATRLAGQGKPVGRLVSLRIAAAKIGLGSLALTGGFSAGREGPSVQVAASIMHYFHRFLPNARVIRANDLILAGGAAGIAAAFNTPLAGIAFAVEELGRKLETRTSGVLLSTIILSGMVAIALQGNYNYIRPLQRAGHHPRYRRARAGRRHRLRAAGRSVQPHAAVATAAWPPAAVAVAPCASSVVRRRLRAVGGGAGVAQRGAVVRQWLRGDHADHHP